MFLITLTYTGTMENVLRLLPEHQRFLDKYYETGHFLVSGPQVPRTGGVIVCRANDRTEIEQIIKEDPFNEIADFHIIEFETKQFTDEFKPLLKESHRGDKYVHTKEI